MSLQLIAKVNRLKKIKADRSALLADRKTKSSAPEVSLEGLPSRWPVWGERLLGPERLKAVHGGRASGKSHTIAEYALMRIRENPALQIVVIRKYRESITYSMKLLFERKISALGWDKYFDIGQIIKSTEGPGFITYKGMQDHNSESIKSFEGFDLAIVEEATELDSRSIEMLIPTIREPGSQIIFLWNPDQDTDPVDRKFRQEPRPSDSVVIPVNFRDNPYLSKESKQDEQDCLREDPEKHEWIWEGGYNLKSDAVIFAGKWRVAEVDTKGWDGPYYGADWGFANDPNALIEAWVSGNQVYISRESYRYRVDTVRIPDVWLEDLGGSINRHVIRADSSRPETISHVRQNGYPRLIPCLKGTGSVEAGINWLLGQEILVNPACRNTQTELKRYRYKQNRGGDVLDQIVDKDNHLIDSLRYALENLIKSRGKQYSESRAYW